MAIENRQLTEADSHSSNDYFSKEENRRAVFYFLLNEYGAEGTALYNLTIRALHESRITIFENKFPEKLIRQIFATVRNVRQEVLKMFDDNGVVEIFLFGEIARRVRERMMGDSEDQRETLGDRQAIPLKEQLA